MTSSISPDQDPARAIGVLDRMAGHHRAMGLVEAARDRFRQAGARGRDNHACFMHDLLTERP
jgi:hypothetical protein